MIEESDPKRLAQIALVVLLIIGCITVLLPFIGAVLFAFVVWISTWRFYAERLLPRLGGRDTLGASLMTLALIMVMLLPTVFLAGSLANGADNLIDFAKPYIEQGLPADPPGWLAALRDRHVGRAIGLLHERPAEPWTIDELGRQVGLSRSALHERFAELVGQPPMQYLTNWRMQRGARLLRESNATVSTIAQEVGYDSEAAFARAFKRLVGLPPATWRRAQRAPSGSGSTRPDSRD